MPKETAPLLEAGDAAECAGLQYLVTRDFGRALYQEVDQRFQEHRVRTWFEQIQAERRDRGLMEYHDPKDLRFLLKELTWHRSVTRMLFPGITSTWDENARALSRLLNLWAHHDIEPSVGNIKILLELFKIVAKGLGLSTFHYHVGLHLARAELILEGKWIQKAGAASVPQEAADYVNQAVEKNKEFKKRPPVGHEWIGRPGKRRVKLSLALRDITENGQSIRGELGPNPEKKISDWLKRYPRGGDLYIDDDGAVMGYVKGVAHLVGWLGEEPKPIPEASYLKGDEFVFDGQDLIPALSQNTRPLSQDMRIKIVAKLKESGYESGTEVDFSVFNEVFVLTDFGRAKPLGIRIED